MHLFYYLFFLEILIAVAAYTNVTEYVFMPVKQRTVQYLSDHRQEIYLMVALGVMLFFHAFRDPLSLVDTPEYYSACGEARLMSWGDVISKGYVELKTETGFALLLKLIVDVFRSPQMLFIITSAFMFFVLYDSIRRYSTIYWFSVLVFMVDSFAQSLFILRGFMALFVFLLSFPFILKRQILPFLLLSILAFSIHMTSIVLIPVYFLYGIKNAKYLALLLVSGLVIVVLGFELILPLIVENLLSNYTYYLLAAEEYEGGNWKMPALLSFILIFRIMVMREHFFEEGINRLCSIALIFAIALYVAGMGFGLINRIALYFSNLTFLILPNTVQYLRSSTLQFVVCLVYILFSGFFFLNSASDVLWVDYQLIKI